MPPFLPGLDLAASFYEEEVGPRLCSLAHSASLIGPGSDVLGYDDVRSTDHCWGPRLQVFVEAGDVARAQAILEALPGEHRGWPTVIGSDHIPFRVHVDVWTAADWVGERLGVDPRSGLSVFDWLALPHQLLLETTSGAVFHDGLGELDELRRSLDWYPHDVWLWLIAAQWRRIGQEEAFVGRTAEVGDDLGSRVITARIVRELMRLCFLLERVYAPYTKWLGSGFARLSCAAEVGPALSTTLGAETFERRESALVEAYDTVGRLHNQLGVTRSVDPTVRLFHGRPYRVLRADRFADSCLEAVADRRLRHLPLVGSVDQWVDSTDVLSHARRVRMLIRWYEGLL